ncbi:MAG: extracellular solute-binding protein [Legionellales bacterium]|nr:extracellular solute-binding protein [Legionellales bacterium]
MKRGWLFVLLSLIHLTLFAKPTEIVLWHSMAGLLGSELQVLTNGFNQSQKNVVVKPIYKGDYIESLTSFAAAFRAHVPPALVQVFEVGTSIMLSPPGIIKPVHELMKEQGAALPTAHFFPSVFAAYRLHGQLMAMPLNSSVPVLYYNADALRQVGYSAETFPKTWDDFELLAKKLNQTGFSCVYTTAYPAWILIESYSAVHGLAMMNGHQKAIYNNPQVIHHLERLLRWQKSHYFVYGGRSDDATILFTSGRCPLLSQSSGAYQGMSAMVPFNIGVASIPLDTFASTKRFNNVAGGAALWVAAGQTPRVYQGIAQFFAYLAKPEVQFYWHQHTGYLPIGIEGDYQFIALKSEQPTLALARSEWFGHDLSPDHGHIPAQNQIRDINDEALENIFAGIKSPQQAMDDAVHRANHTVGRFLENTTHA